MHKLIITFCAMALAGCHGSAELNAVPSSLADCGSNTRPSAVTVTWDATKATKGGTVNLWVQNSDTFKPTLWIEDRPVGSAVTGNWALPDTRITLTDAANGDKLAEISIGATTCKQ